MSEQQRVETVGRDLDDRLSYLHSNLIDMFNLIKALQEKVKRLEKQVAETSEECEGIEGMEDRLQTLEDDLISLDNRNKSNLSGLQWTIQRHTNERMRDLEYKVRKDNRILIATNVAIIIIGVWIMFSCI